MPYIDADDVAREVVEPGEYCLNKIVSHFGDAILNTAGQLDRAKLRTIIFANPNEKAWLENLTHPVIQQRIVAHLQKASGPYVLLVHPLLFEKGHETLCDFTIAVSVPRETQVARVIARDNNSAAQIESILAAQMSDNDRNAKANCILKNTSNHQDLSGTVIKLHTKILELTA